MPQGSINVYFYLVVGGEYKSGETIVPSHKCLSFCCILNDNTTFQAMKHPCACLVPFHRGQLAGKHRFTDKSVVISQSQKRLEIRF